MATVQEAVAASQNKVDIATAPQKRKLFQKKPEVVDERKIAKETGVAKHELQGSGETGKVTLSEQQRKEIAERLRGWKHTAEQIQQDQQALGDWDRMLLSGEGEDFAARFERGQVSKRDLAVALGILREERYQKGQAAGIDVVTEIREKGILRKKKIETRKVVTTEDRKVHFTSAYLEKTGFQDWERKKQEDDVLELDALTIALEKSIGFQQSGVVPEFSKKRAGDMLYNTVVDRQNAILQAEYNNMTFAELQRKDPMAAERLRHRAMQDGLLRFSTETAKAILEKERPTVEPEMIRIHAEALRARALKLEEPPSEEELNAKFKSEIGALKRATSEYATVERIYNKLDKDLSVCEAGVDQAKAEAETAEATKNAAQRAYDRAKESFHEDKLKENIAEVKDKIAELENKQRSMNRKEDKEHITEYDGYLQRERAKRDDLERELREKQDEVNRLKRDLGEAENDAERKQTTYKAFTDRLKELRDDETDLNDVKPGLVSKAREALEEKRRSKEMAEKALEEKRLSPENKEEAKKLRQAADDLERWQELATTDQYQVLIDTVYKQGFGGRFALDQLGNAGVDANGQRIGAERIREMILGTTNREWWFKPGNQALARRMLSDEAILRGIMHVYGGDTKIEVRIPSPNNKSVFVSSKENYISLLKGPEQAGRNVEKVRAELDQAKINADRDRPALNKAKSELEAVRGRAEKSWSEVQSARRVVEQGKNEIALVEVRLIRADAEVLARENRVKQVEREITGARSAVEQSTQRVENSRSSVERWNIRNEDTRINLEFAESELELKKGEGAGNDELAKLQQEFNEIESYLAHGREMQAAEEKKLAEEERELTRLKTDLTEKEKNKQELEKGLTEKEKNKQELEKELADKEARQQVLEKELNDKLGVQTQLEKKLADKNSILIERSKSQNRVNQLEGDLKNEERKLEEAKLKREQLWIAVFEKVRGGEKFKALDMMRFLVQQAEESSMQGDPYLEVPERLGGPRTMLEQEATSILEQDMGEAEVQRRSFVWEGELRNVNARWIRGGGDAANGEKIPSELRCRMRQEFGVNSSVMTVEVRIDNEFLKALPPVADQDMNPGIRDFFYEKGFLHIPDRYDEWLILQKGGFALGADLEAKLRQFRAYVSPEAEQKVLAGVANAVIEMSPEDRMRTIQGFAEVTVDTVQTNAGILPKTQVTYDSDGEFWVVSRDYAADGTVTSENEERIEAFFERSLAEFKKRKGHEQLTPAEQQEFQSLYRKYQQGMAKEILRDLGK